MRVRLLTIALILLTVSAVLPQTQGRFWVLVNGALRYTGSIGVGNGTATAPSYSFTSDPNTGLYLSGAHTVQAQANGANIFLWGTNGVAFQSQIFLATTAFASLGTPSNGAAFYCSDCTVTTAASCPATSASCVCAGSGTGALAFRLNSVWDCTVHH